MDSSKLSQDELVEKLKQQVALENIELLLTVSSNIDNNLWTKIVLQILLMFAFF